MQNLFESTELHLDSPPVAMDIAASGSSRARAAELAKRLTVSGAVCPVHIRDHRRHVPASRSCAKRIEESRLGRRGLAVPLASAMLVYMYRATLGLGRNPHCQRVV